MDIACVGAIVRDGNGRVVVVKRGRPPGAGTWSIPGGRIEPGETDHEAVRREVAEETGLQIIVDRLAGSVVLPALEVSDRYRVNDYFAHVAPGTLTEPCAGDDAADARWVTERELLGLEVTAGLAATLRSWKVWG